VQRSLSWARRTKNQRGQRDLFGEFHKTNYVDPFDLLLSTAGATVKNDSVDLVTDADIQTKDALVDIETKKASGKP